MTVASVTGAVSGGANRPKATDVYREGSSL